MSTITGEFLDRPIFRIVRDVAAEKGVRAYVIGGFVRDCFLGRPCTDVDIVVEGSGIDFARAVGERTHSHVSYFKNFGTAMLHYRGDEVEFVGARRESYRRESRKPIVENGTLEDDQKRRDFTINAMAFSLQREDFGALVDPFGGIRDLDAGIIRTPLDPDTTYSDDPLRMLRAVRFAAKLSTPERRFTIVPESMASMRRMADRLQILSCERRTSCPNSSPSRASKPSTAAATRIISPTPWPSSPTWWKRSAQCPAVPDTKGFGSGVADLAIPLDSRRVGGMSLVDGQLVVALTLGFSGELQSYSCTSGEHLATHAFADSSAWSGGWTLVPKATDSAVRRLLFDAGDDIDDLMLLCNADITSKNEAKVARIRANFELVRRKLVEVEEKDAIRNFKNPIDGEYVMRVYGIPPCREIGLLKDLVKEAILDGVIGNNFEEADAFMRLHAPEFGLHEV